MNSMETHRDQLHLLGVGIDNPTLAEGTAWIVDRAEKRLPTTVAFVNAHCLNEAYDSPEYRAALTRADAVFADGIGVRLAGRHTRQPVRDNVNGTDMFPRLAALAEEKGLSIFLLGARPGVAEAVADGLRERHPRLRIAGTRDGYFAADEEDAVIAEINESGADILLVAMGVPTQELWLDRHRASLRVPVCMAVGGLFDFYSGNIPRAPRWLRACGGEWCWRLAQEPGRLWRRYLIGNPRFLYRVWRHGRRAEAEDILDLYDGVAWRFARRRMRMQSKRMLWRAGQAGSRWAKRSLDVLVASAILLLASPLLALVALAVRVDSPGPVLFRQLRVGRNGRLFRMLKFRSMYVDAEARLRELEAQNEMQGGVLFKMKRDPRVTRVGRVLRKLSIDELPQLWHVVSGDMSLVGPRPPLPAEVARYTPAQRRRLSVTPGLTCIWQVSGRSDLPFERQVELDVDYIFTRSLWVDLWLLLRTVPAVLSGRGAY